MFIKAKYYLDKRYLNKEGKAHVKIAIRKNGECGFISTAVFIFPDTWDRDHIIGNDRQTKILNGVISSKKAAIDLAILELSSSGAFLNKSISEIINLILVQTDPGYAEECMLKKKNDFAQKNGFFSKFLSFTDNIYNKGTKGLYKGTLKKLGTYCSKEGIKQEGILFDDINKSWLESFESYCLQTEKQNTVAIHLRNIRAVFNAAIDEGITTNYPFRKFKIKKEESRDKSYTAKELRRLFSYKCYPGGEQEAVDMFKLMFFLIGINAVDLANLSNPIKGRAEYQRTKTHKFYSIKIQPEAMEIIKKYKGTYHLINILERCPNYKTYFNRLGKTLRKVGKTRVDGKKSIGEPLLQDVCTGSARTSWATIAQEELDIPRDVIAAALGHHTIDVTSTYLRTDWKKKIDEANRKVLDWVLYEKKG